MEIGIILSFVINLLLLGLLIWDKVRFDGRERDLLNRLMSRDFGQYVQGMSMLGKPQKAELPEGYVPIEQAASILAEEGLLADQSIAAAKEDRQPAAAIRVGS